MRNTNLVGEVFNSWTVVSRAENKRNGAARWNCVCSCGNIGVITTGDLKAGNSTKCRSCASSSVKHGHAKRTRFSPTYQSWATMKSRCTNPNTKRYKDYGGRGIKFCEEWSTFENFLSDMGERPKGTTLDRINVNGDYNPNNCRWANASEQSANVRKRSNCSTPYIGVVEDKTGYVARVFYNGDCHYLGTFRTAEDAANCRDAYVIANNWPHRLNMDSKQ